MKIGSKNKIHFQVESQSGTFAKHLLTINNHLLIHAEGNLSFLCVDLEGVQFIWNDRFQNNYLWKIHPSKLAQLWKVFFNARSLEELESEDVVLFDFNIQQVQLPFKSDFFDEYIFIGFKDEVNWYLKGNKSGAIVKTDLIFK